MWVMLLWSLTLPGHEVLVYDYLVQGSVQESVMRFNASGLREEHQALNPQQVQAFPDAQTAPMLVLKQVLHVSPLLLLPLFSKAFPDAALTYASPVSTGQLLLQVLPVSVLPNAP